MRGSANPLFSNSPAAESRILRQLRSLLCAITARATPKSCGATPGPKRQWIFRVPHFLAFATRASPVESLYLESHCTLFALLPFSCCHFYFVQLRMHGSTSARLSNLERNARIAICGRTESQAADSRHFRAGERRHNGTEIY